MNAKGLLLLLLATSFISYGCTQDRSGEEPQALRPLGRVVAIGFDGLDPVLLKMWMDGGKLPNFRLIAERGTLGELLSVLPPTSPAAWTSAVTGVNPGKHGLYGFMKSSRENTSRIAFSTSRERGFAAVWEILSRHGRRSCIINIPLTSPPDSLNGVMIAGFPLASDDWRARYWPKKLEQYIKECGYGMHLIPVEEVSAEEKFRAKMNSITSSTFRIGIKLFENEQWDLYWLVFTFTDRYQHYFWKYFDSKHPRYDPEKAKVYSTEIERAYCQADQYLGEFLKRLEPQDILIVMSDHGFGPLYYALNTENFITKTFGDLKYVRYADFVGGVFRIVLPSQQSKHYLTIRSRLVNALLHLSNPGDGTAIIDSVYVKEEIYKGPYLATAPDVVCLEKPGYVFMKLQRTPDVRLIDSGPKPGVIYSGYHSRIGTIALYGNGIRHLEGFRARIIDIAPIIFAYLGVPAPSEIDGKLHREVFTEEILSELTPLTSKLTGYRKPGELPSEDAHKIRKQLRAVGYMQ